jgi:hypothetical protein
MTQALATTNDMDLMTLGQTLAKSGYFQDTREAAQAVVKVLAGREMGIGPIAAMTGIYIVKGRVTLSANLMAAQIKRSGKYDYRIVRMDDTGCVIDYYQAGEKIGSSAFVEADARGAGLLGGDNWKKFPRNMYFARAMSNGAKWYCPDVFSGPVYTPDELADERTPQLPPAPPVDVVTGEVIEAAFDPEPARAAIAALPGATAADIAAAEDLDDRDMLRELYREVKARKNGMPVEELPL